MAILKENLRFKQLRLNYTNSQKKQTEKKTLISSIRVGVVAKTDDEVYVSSTITMYSYFSFVFSEVKFFARCSLLILFARCSLLFARCPLLFARCSLLFTRCSLLFARCSLLFTRCSLLFTRYSTRNSEGFFLVKVNKRFILICAKTLICE